MSTVVQPILYLIAVVDLLLAVIVLSRGFRNIKNIFFGLIAFSTALWSIAIVGFYSGQTIFHINWLVYTHFFAIAIAFLFLLFVLRFPKNALYKNFITGVASVLFVLISTMLFVGGFIVGSPTGVYTYELYLWYPLYALVMLGFFITGYIVLIRQYQKLSNPTEKAQVLYVLIGTVTASSLAIVPDLLLPYFSIFNFTWLGPVCTLVMVGAIFIAMAKHHLFNVKIILAEIFTVALIGSLVIEMTLVESVTALIYKTGVLIIVSVFSYLLIRSIYKEIQARQEIERLAKDLEKANARLRELDQLKSEFLSIASHQMRSPLTAIKGYASLILEGSYGVVSEAVQQAVDHMFKATNSMISVVENFLNVSRIEQGRMKYDFVTHDIAALVGEVIAELEPNIKEKGLAIAYHRSPGIDYLGNIDTDKLKQVFMNLIDNAVKYTPQGSITVTAGRPDHTVRISIKDTGVGMNDEDKKRLFQKFGRAQDANNVNVKGTGLGLYLAKEIVEAHKGHISVESEGKGKGSTFIVELPAVTEN